MRWFTLYRCSFATDDLVYRPTRTVGLFCNTMSTSRTILNVLMPPPFLSRESLSTARLFAATESAASSPLPAAPLGKEAIPFDEGVFMSLEESVLPKRSNVDGD